MNSHFDKDGKGNLAQRVLADESWSAFDSQLRKDALQAFSTANRRRRRGYLAAQSAAIFLAAGVAAWTLRPHPRSISSTKESNSREYQPHICCHKVSCHKNLLITGNTSVVSSQPARMRFRRELELPQVPVRSFISSSISRSERSNHPCRLPGP